MKELKKEITERKLRETRQAAQFALTRIFAEVPTLREAIPEILKTVCEGFGWELGELWTIDNYRNVLWLESMWHVPSLDASEFEKVSRTMSFSPGVDLSGRVWSSGQPVVCISDVVTDNNFPRVPYAKKIGLHGAVAFPLTIKDKINGVIAFFSKQIRPIDDELGNIMADIGRRIGSFINRKLVEDMLSASEYKYRTLLENLPQRIFHKDRDSKYVSCNENYARDLKIKADEIVGKTDYDFYPKELADKYRAGDKRVLELEQAEEIEDIYIKDGQKFIVQKVKTPLKNGKGNIIGIIGTFWDITERKRMEDQIRTLSLATEQSPSVVIITDTAGNIEYVNRKFTKVTGYALEEVVGKNPRILKSGKTPPERYKELWDTITAGDEWRGEIINKKKSGELYWAAELVSPIKDSRVAITHFVGLSEDITERKKNEELLVFLADHDPLTHLHNRRYFVEQLRNWIVQMKRHKESGALILLDLDNFKYINDTLGHQEGDMLLIKLAGVLRKQARETDVVARLGGDEFAIILPFTTQEQVQAVSGRILLSIKEYCRIDKISGYGITVSIGIVQFPEYGDNATLLLSCADIAMYTAKEEGRNRICIFEHKHKAKIDSRLVWEHRIQKALKEDLFVLYLQPIYDIRKEIVCGYEVLLRMLGENREIIMPNDFLPVAERYGLIHEIDRWVVRKALRLFVAYKVSEKGQFLDINLSYKNKNQLRGNDRRSEKGKFLDINLSGQAFNDKGLLPFIQKEISETGISPESIVFEITETASIENMVESAHFISTLKLFRCRFAIDDFGSGFSSYHYLKNLPVDYLKIDGSFIRNLHESRMDQHLVKGIVEMARGLEKKTIAEYVENEKTLQLLREYGVDYAQGYYIGKPKPASEVFKADKEK